MPFKMTVRCSSRRVQAFVSGDTSILSKVGQVWAQTSKSTVETILRNLVPVKTGTLRDSVASDITPKGFSVYTTAPYAKFVDQDTKPHMIFARPGGVLHWVDAGGKDCFARSVHHPGTKGQHFLTKARDAAKQILRQAYTDAWASVL